MTCLTPCTLKIETQCGVGAVHILIKQCKSIQTRGESQRIQSSARRNSCCWACEAGGERLQTEAGMTDLKGAERDWHVFGKFSSLGWSSW